MLRDTVQAAWATLERSTVGSLPPAGRQAALDQMAALEANLEAAARRCDG